MTYRLCLATAFCTAVLTSCAPPPAYADAYPDRDNMPADPASPGWRPPSGRSVVIMGGHHYDYDPGAGPIPFDRLKDNIWRVTPGAWGSSTTPLSLPAPNPVKRCRPVPEVVPGPLPLAGAVVAFGWARRIRRRITSGNRRARSKPVVHE